jgi:hypothetical protein
MNEDHNYISLSQQLENLAADSADTGLSAAYRALAIQYRALDFWHQRFTKRFQAVAAEPNERSEQE